MALLNIITQPLGAQTSLIMLGDIIHLSSHVLQLFWTIALLRMLACQKIGVTRCTLILNRDMSIGGRFISFKKFAIQATKMVHHLKF